MRASGQKCQNPGRARGLFRQQLTSAGQGAGLPGGLPTHITKATTPSPPERRDQRWVF